MKINWGTGIVIGLAAFIAFILFFVIKMSIDDTYSHDLVVEEYYKQELVLQQEIDAKNNMKLLSENIAGKKTPEGWLLTFPKEIFPEKVSGTISLYRPSNKKLDFEIPLQLSNPNVLIPDEHLVHGRWNISVHWEYEGKAYLYEEKIVY